ncbi:HOMEOBOX-LEUCINE ZIPPER PROTEIN [Salix viminalis]|uniref:Homeobox-leucine zipper protein n=1 Tax=Salix viminalis TaxID=40686 RepID=A0A9Q0U6T8_SALVM|nr:HOMEOBOX-LEUCINE ZIPPER PROTEIN [Salix viminalis]
MNLFHSQNQKLSKHQNSSSSSSSRKKRLTQDQVRLLERTFTTSKKLEPELKAQLASQLGVPPRQISIWYQNKRARWKTQNLELDYNTLHLKLENVLADRRRLEREVAQLQEELRRAQQMVFDLNRGPAQPPVNVSSNSSLDEDAGGEVLQLDELYACWYHEWINS